MFDGVQTTAAAAAAAAAAGTPTATTTDPRDSFITTLCSCTHQQQHKHQQQQFRPSRKEETKSDRTRRIRVSSSLPNCAFSREPKAEAEQHQSDVTAPEPVSLASVLNCSHKQQQQQKGRGGRGCGVVGAVEKAKSRGPPEQRQQHNHHTPQHMAFLGTVRETVEFLRGTIGRSRRKGADLAGGRELAQRAGPGNNGNGVCPAPDNANGPSACTSTGQQQPPKRTVLISFSQTGSAQCARKTVQSVDTCVADSFDDQMVDKMCALPKGLDRHEWLASHVLALFEHVNCLSSTLSEVCTPVTCSTMSYPGNSKAQWVDERGKRHNYSAMRYIDSVMALCEGSRKNQSLFPTKYGASFAAEFEQYCARMVRLLWHCAGHAYAKHWEHLTALNLRLQFGLVLAHMAKLAKLYSLMSDKELSPLMHTLQLARPSTTTMTTASASDSCEQPSSGAVIEQQQQHRPTKRALDDSTLTTTAGTTTASNGSSTAVQGRAIQQQKKAHKREAKEDCKQAQHHPQHCTLKSGSWGGHSASTVALTVAPAAAVADYGSELVKKNCQQQQQQKCCCAQTC